MGATTGIDGTVEDTCSRNVACGSMSLFTSFCSGGGADGSNGFLNCVPGATRFFVVSSLSGTTHGPHNSDVGLRCVPSPSGGCCSELTILLLSHTVLQFPAQKTLHIIHELYSHYQSAGSFTARGSVNVKQEPGPGVPVTSMRPCCASTICLTIARPRPEPPVAREREASAR